MPEVPGPLPGAGDAPDAGHGRGISLKRMGGRNLRALLRHGNPSVREAGCRTVHPAERGGPRGDLERLQETAGGIEEGRGEGNRSRVRVLAAPAMEITFGDGDWMRPAGLEPAAFGAGNRRSAPLSYGRMGMEGGEGFEPPAPRGAPVFETGAIGRSANLPGIVPQCPRRDSNPRTPPEESQADRENPLPYWGLYPCSVPLQPAACDPFP